MQIAETLTQGEIGAHHDRRAVVHQKLITIAQCAGLLPPPEPVEAVPHNAIDAAIDGTNVPTAAAADDEPLPRMFGRPAGNGAMAH